MTCRELVQLAVADGIDAFGPEERRHLRDCDGCTAYVESLDVTVRSLGALPAQPADPHVREYLLAAFRELRA